MTPSFFDLVLYLVSLAENYHLGVSFGQLFPFIVFEQENVLTVLNRRRTDSSAFLMDSGKEQCTWSHESPVGSQTCPLHRSVALINQAFPLSLICKAGLLTSSLFSLRVLVGSI